MSLSMTAEEILCVSHETCVGRLDGGNEHMWEQSVYDEERLLCR